MSPSPPNYVESRDTLPILVDVESADELKKYNLTTKRKRNSPSPVLFTASPQSLSNVSRRIPSLLMTIGLLALIWWTYQWGIKAISEPTIIIITPTHKRPERMADMTRMSQTLMHIKNIHWIVIEDANKTVEIVDRLLQRTGIPYVYFYTTTKPGFPKRGWTHRNMGLEYVRKYYKNYKKDAVVYFADDDNSYDVRLFDKYVRKVKTIGVWPVGLVGGAVVEAPHVENGTITRWDVVYAPKRKYAVDMAGFAVNLQLILRSNASFNEGCTKSAPESCFLAQFGVDKKDAQPFGHDDYPKDLLVWHTKTRNIPGKGSNHGYNVE